MRKYGLIGFPLSHSFSPDYFQSKFSDLNIHDAQYDLYPLKSLSEWGDLKKHELRGINVTIPYKQAVIPLLDNVSEEALAIGAVNTVKFTPKGAVGFNTDVFGFESSLKAFLQGATIDLALVLGTGGSARAVWFVLERMGIQFIRVSRVGGDIVYDELTSNQISQAKLIINTTPLGMTPYLEDAPLLSYSAIGREHYLFDLVYNPSKTLFLQRGEINGASIKNGLEMLEKQADKAWAIWSDAKEDYTNSSSL